MALLLLAPPVGGRRLVAAHGVGGVRRPEATTRPPARTLKEIAAWGRMTEPERLAIMAQLPARLAAKPS